MKVLLLIGAFLITGCAAEGRNYDMNDSTRMVTYHDDLRSVTCWVNTREGGVFCMRDKELE